MSDERPDPILAPGERPEDWEFNGDLWPCERDQEQRRIGWDACMRWLEERGKRNDLPVELMSLWKRLEDAESDRDRYLSDRHEFCDMLREARDERDAALEEVKQLEEWREAVRRHGHRPSGVEA